MRLGAHLPLIDFGKGVVTIGDLRAYARAAVELGFAALSANDHLVWRRPWLDGPTALASVASEARGATLATSVALPAVRHPVVLAKALASLAVLTGGSVVAGLGPGSSADDYRAVGLRFEERWARFDEAFAVVRALLRGEPVPAGAFYAGAQVALAPLPERPPQVWFGSWGSDALLRRMARVADGWLASGYNTTPERYGEARARLDGHLRAVGREPGVFPDAVATMWLHVTEDRAAAQHTLERVLAPLLGRAPEDLVRQLPVGSPEHCVELLRAYEHAGAGLVILWPVVDPVGQLHAIAEHARGSGVRGV